MIFGKLTKKKNNHQIELSKSPENFAQFSSREQYESSSACLLKFEQVLIKGNYSTVTRRYQSRVAQRLRLEVRDGRNIIS